MRTSNCADNEIFELGKIRMIPSGLMFVDLRSEYIECLSFLAFFVLVFVDLWFVGVSI